MKKTILVSTKDEEQDVPLPGFLKQIRDAEWDVSEVRPGDKVELSAKLSGFQKPPSVTFDIYPLSGRKADVGQPLTTLTGDVSPDAKLTKAKWTVPKDGLPPEVVFFAKVGSLRCSSPVLPVDRPCVIESEWDPEEAPPGREVKLKTHVYKVPKGEKVTFKIFWERADKVVQHMEDVTAELDEEGKATATWTIPTVDKLKEKDEDGTGKGLKKDDPDDGEADPDDEDPDEGSASVPSLTRPTYVFSFEMQVAELADPAENNVLVVRRPKFVFSS
jgi:hypothetical protein